MFTFPSVFRASRTITHVLVPTAQCFEITSSLVAFLPAISFRIHRRYTAMPAIQSRYLLWAGTARLVEFLHILILAGAFSAMLASGA
jgi:hypothetical protein